MTDETSVAASSAFDGADCTTCTRRIGAPEYPVLTWEPSDAPFVPGDPRRRPDHIEHARCYLERVPRRALA